MENETLRSVGGTNTFITLIHNHIKKKFCCPTNALQVFQDQYLHNSFSFGEIKIIQFKILICLFLFGHVNKPPLAFPVLVIDDFPK